MRAHMGGRYWSWCICTCMSAWSWGCQASLTQQELTERWRVCFAHESHLRQCCKKAHGLQGKARRCQEKGAFLDSPLQSRQSPETQIPQQGPYGASFWCRHRRQKRCYLPLQLRGVVQGSQSEVSFLPFLVVAVSAASICNF